MITVEKIRDALNREFSQAERFTALKGFLEEINKHDGYNFKYEKLAYTQIDQIKDGEVAVSCIDNFRNLAFLAKIYSEPEASDLNKAGDQRAPE